MGVGPLASLSDREASTVVFRSAKGRECGNDIECFKRRSCLTRRPYAERTTAMAERPTVLRRHRAQQKSGVPTGDAAPEAPHADLSARKGALTCCSMLDYFDAVRADSSSASVISPSKFVSAC